MSLHGHKLSVGIAAMGILVAVAHLALGIAAVLTLNQWLSGAALGLLITGAAGTHLLIGLRSRSRLIDHEPEIKA